MATLNKHTFYSKGLLTTNIVPKLFSKGKKEGKVIKTRKKTCKNMLNITKQQLKSDTFHKVLHLGLSVWRVSRVSPI